MNLLDFYKEHVLTDPEVGDEDIRKVLEISNKFNGIDYMYHVFQTFSDLQNYMGYRTNGFPEYFKAERLKDLESFWMRGYDDNIRSLDYEVERT